MTVKKMTLKGETVDFAIRQALAQIGLPKEETVIRIHQRESANLFGYREAIISVIYDGDASHKALSDKQRRELRSRFLFRFDGGQAQVKLPSSFYGEDNQLSAEQRKELLLSYLEEQEVDIESLEEEQLEKLLTDPSCQYGYTTVCTLDTILLNKKGASIHLKIDDEQMVCRAIIFHAAGPTLPEDVYNTLKEAHVVKGIRRANIEKVCRSRFSGYFEVAHGLPAIDDSPGPMELYFQEDEHREFAKMMELLTIDTRAVKEINIADRNQLLIQLDDIVTGSNGYRINGEIIHKKDITDSRGGLALGPNVYASDDGKQIFSRNSGHIVWRKDSQYIDVEPIYIVEENVDFSEGNIIGFVGKVLIKGDVKAKFTVQAEGNVEIHGSVEDAIVRSTGGSVMVGGGIIHRSEGYVEAKDTVHCSIATNANIRANKIVIEKEAMNSDLRAEDSIEVIGNPGVVVGGKLDARLSIRVNTLGSERWVSTEVHCGDIKDYKKRTKVINQSLQELRTQLKDAEQIKMILESRKENFELTSSQDSQLAQANAEIPELQAQYESLVEEEESIKEEINRRRKSSIEVLKTLYPQVELNIFDAHFMPNTTEKYSGFNCRRAQINRYPL